jgi:hypothetical protein
MTVKHHNCRRRQRRYSNIQIHDRIVFASFYNCYAWRSCICMIRYRLCLLLQLWCLLTNTWPSNITIVEGGKDDTLTYKYMTVKYQNCRSRQRRWYSNIQIHAIVMFDGHIFVCWSIVFASFYNCYAWRSCICMIRYRLCLLLQLWCLVVMYLYARVSSLPPFTIVMFEGHVFVDRQTSQF